MSELILENYHELPIGWSLTSLDDISLKLRAGGTPSTKNQNYYKNGDIPFVKIDDISNSGKYLNSTKIRITENGLKNSSAWKIPKNSILYSMYASYGIPIINRFLVSSSQAIIAFVPPSPNLICIDYVYYFLLSIKSKLITKGTVQKNLNAEIIRHLAIKLPPINEQKRIAEKIKEFFLLIDSILEMLDIKKSMLVDYQKSILENAFNGNLTENWRKRNLPNLVDTKRLLQKIQTPENFKNKKPSLSSQKLYNLPKNWDWVKLNDVSVKIVDGTHFKPTYTPNGIPFISVKDVKYRKINFDDTKFVSQKTHQELSKRCNPEFGDVLFVKTGATIGRTAVVNTKNKFSLFVSVALVKPKSEFIVPKYLSYMLEDHVNHMNINLSLKGVAIKNYHLEDMRLIDFPLTSISEQIEIVKEIEYYFSIIIHLEKQISNISKSCLELKSSIFKQVFEGKLVPQDPNDEPAEILLQKIKQEKEQLKQKEKSKKRKKNGR